jgi:hypothetical protein
MARGSAFLRGELRCCHVSHSPGGLWTTGIKKGLDALGTQLGSCVFKTRSCVTETSAGASVTTKHALETRESGCVPRAAKPFFISVVHSPSGAVRHEAAPELSS